jgi:hypothetical protein
VDKLHRERHALQVQVARLHQEERCLSAGELEEGVDHAEEIGFGEVIERGLRAVEGLPAELVYAAPRAYLP